MRFIKQLLCKHDYETDTIITLNDSTKNFIVKVEICNICGKHKSKVIDYKEEDI